MLPGLRLPAVLELVNVCYKSFSLIFGGDGAGGTEEEVLEFCADGFSSRSWDFSLVLVLVDVAVVVDVVAPFFGVFSAVFSCFSGGCSVGADAFDCQFTSSIDTNFFRRSRY
jgi:hypothetical protein